MKAQLADHGFHDGITDDQSLIDAGIMDSLAILTTISFIDEEFGIMPNEDELFPENFDSISAICDFVEKKRAQD